MITFNGFIAGQKAIGFHVEFFLSYLHDKRRTQVDEVSVANIRKQRIRKTIWVLLQQLIKFCLPKKINKPPPVLWQVLPGGNHFQNDRYGRTRCVAMAYFIILKIECYCKDWRDFTGVVYPFSGTGENDSSEN